MAVRSMMAVMGMDVSGVEKGAERAARASNHAGHEIRSGLGGALHDLQHQFGRGSDLNHFIHALSLGGPLLGVGLLAKELTEMAHKSAELAEQFHKGELAAGDLFGGIVKEIPILGQLTKMWSALGEAIGAAFGHESDEAFNRHMEAANKASEQAAEGRRKLEEGAPHLSVSKEADELRKENQRFNEQTRQLQKISENVEAAHPRKIRGAFSDFGDEVSHLFDDPQVSPLEAVRRQHEEEDKQENSERQTRMREAWGALESAQKTHEEQVAKIKDEARYRRIESDIAESNAQLAREEAFAQAEIGIRAKQLEDYRLQDERAIDAQVADAGERPDPEAMGRRANDIINANKRSQISHAESILAGAGAFAAVAPHSIEARSGGAAALVAALSAKAAGPQSLEAVARASLDQEKRHTELLTKMTAVLESLGVKD